MFYYIVFLIVVMNVIIFLISVGFFKAIEVYAKMLYRRVFKKRMAGKIKNFDSYQSRWEIIRPDMDARPAAMRAQPSENPISPKS